MPYRIAGIDVHKRMLAVVVADVAVDGEYVFERRLVGTTPDQLRALAGWLVERDVEEVVMESTAQYWRPVWEALERWWQPIRRIRVAAGPAAGALHLAQAQSNHGPRGRKQDFPDAERLVKRLVAHELILSFVPDVTQRLWRTVARRKYQSTCNRVQLQNRLECLLEEMHIKLSSLVADLIGPSARRMLRAIANGETDPGAVAALGSRRLQATPDQLRDALGACTDLHPVYRRLLTLTLDELEVIERHIHQLDEELAQLLRGLRMPSNGSRLCRASGWIPRTRSSPKSAPQRRHSRPRSGWLRGSVPVPGTTRARGSITAIARRTAIGKCAGCLIRPPTPR
jgi:transposase